MHIQNAQNVSHPKGVKKGQKPDVSFLDRAFSPVANLEKGIFVSGSPPALNILNAYVSLCKYGKPYCVQYIS